MAQEENVVDSIKSKYSWVDIVFGTHNLHKLPNILKESMENKTFDKAALMLNEPEKIRVYRFGNTVYKVGNFFAKKNTETMKEILERTIRREAKSQVKN